jgi:hypothetical protein
MHVFYCLDYRERSEWALRSDLSLWSQVCGASLLMQLQHDIERTDVLEISAFVVDCTLGSALMLLPVEARHMSAWNLDVDVPFAPAPS